MAYKQKTKNRYSGYALMPQSLEKDWWLILEVRHLRNGNCAVYYTCQIVGFDNAFKRYKQLVIEEAKMNDATNNGQLELFVQQQQV